MRAFSAEGSSDKFRWKPSFSEGKASRPEVASGDYENSSEFTQAGNRGKTYRLPAQTPEKPLETTTGNHVMVSTQGPYNSAGNLPQYEYINPDGNAGGQEKSPSVARVVEGEQYEELVPRPLPVSAVYETPKR